MRRKCWVILSFVMVLLTGIAVRLWYIVRAQPAQAAASQNRWTVSVATTRGTIYDTALIPLVNDTHEYRAAMIPSETLLAHVNSATTIQEFTSLRDQLSKGVPASVRLTKPIGFQDGMRLFWVPVRYSERLLAPHIIGYLDAGGSYGLTGIESAFDAYLNKYSGKATASFGVDGRGNLLYGVSPDVTDTTKNSVGGVVLTLDKNLQEVTENVCEERLDKGAVVIMEPHSGDILAMASYPSYQPQTIADSINTDNGALLNRALSLFDCGSIFKIVTTAAALESGISANTSFTCEGFLDVDGTRFHCHNRLGHGRLTMYEGFAQSCNLYYIQLAQEVGGDTLLAMAGKFGLSNNIRLADGLQAPAALLPQLRDIQTSRAALANLSFGQGYLMASPLHFTRIACAVANDGFMPPITLVKGFVDEKQHFSSSEKGRGERIISLDTAHLLQEMMELTVQEGTGHSASPTNCLAAGKTGTAETGQIIDGRRVVQSWFVGYFPVHNPQYAVCVLVEDSDTSQTKATEIFRLLADEILPLNK